MNEETIVSAVGLTAEEIEYLMVLLSQDIRSDREQGLHGSAERHLVIWDKLHLVHDEEI
jgi:hypothetical protein